MARDEIAVRGMTFYGYHGAKPEEKTLGQRFVVDVLVRADLSAAGKSDDLADTVDYGQIHRAVRAVVEGESLNLIEAVATRICVAVLKISDLIEEAETIVRKPSAPIAGVLEGAEVRMVRRREAG